MYGGWFWIRVVSFSPQKEKKKTFRYSHSIMIHLVLPHNMYVDPFSNEQFLFSDFPIFCFSHFQISTSEIACFYKKNPVLRWGIQLLGICGIVQLRSSFWLTTCLRSEGESLASSARKMRVFSQKRVACGVVLKLQRVHILEICVSHSWRLYSLPARWQVLQGIHFS